MHGRCTAPQIGQIYFLRRPQWLIRHLKERRNVPSHGNLTSKLCCSDSRRKGSDEIAGPAPEPIVTVSDNIEGEKYNFIMKPCEHLWCGPHILFKVILMWGLKGTYTHTSMYMSVGLTSRTCHKLINQIPFALTWRCTQRTSIKLISSLQCARLILEK